MKNKHRSFLIANVLFYRPLSDRVEPRLSGSGILSEKTQLPANSSCAVSVLLYLRLQVPGKEKQMFFKNVYETSVFKVHINRTQTLAFAACFLKLCTCPLEFAWANLYPWALETPWFLH